MFLARFRFYSIATNHKQYLFLGLRQTPNRDIGSDRPIETLSMEVTVRATP